MKTYKQNGWDVPEGFALVPAEPTEEMRIEGAQEADYYERNARDCYAAMLAAAPQPPAKQEVGAEPVAWRSKQSPHLISLGGSRLPSADWEALYAATPATKAIRDAALEEDDDDYPAGFSDWYNREFANQVADTKHMSHCEEAWRAALIRALKGGAA